MLRLLFVLSALVLIANSTLAAPPNVVLILADDLGARDLGSYGSKYHRTPNLDQFAREGVFFSRAYAACPVCSPTRASILTGLYPQRVGITDWLPGRPDRPDQRLQRPVPTMQLAHEVVTIADALKAKGYSTAHIGKWHLGGEGFDPTTQGFDLNIAGDHTGTPRSYFAPFRKKQGGMPGLEQAPEGEYLTDRLTDEAVKFIESQKQKPFFLYLAHYAPHTPMRAKAEMIAKYQPGPHGTQGHPTYAAMVESVDESVGRVLKTLNDLKLADNTLVIFTSDNGGLATLEGMIKAPTFNGPLREGKGYLYEGGIRVPLLIRGPGFGGTTNTCRTNVCTIDLLPTILTACETALPPGIDGVPLQPIVAGSNKDRGPLYWHYPHYANQGSRPGGAIIDGNIKLIEHYETGRHELFDLAKDERESRNLAAEKPELVKSLAGKLAQWRTAVGAKMPTPNQNYHPNPQGKDGTIILHSRTAIVHGNQLRYEPLPHKETLGFWTDPSDYATYDFVVAHPGKFTVEVLQGCGKGSGGSEVEVRVGESAVRFVVKETGGFQKFEPREIGRITIDQPGLHTLMVKPINKPGVAVMDLRRVVLKPAKVK